MAKRTAEPAVEVDPPAPWEQQDGESGPAWDAFREYRDMPTAQRSLRSLSQQLSKSIALVSRWSRDWGWQDRCIAFDRYNDRVMLAEAEEARRDMVRRHTQASVQFVTTALRRLIGDEANNVDKLDVNKLSANDVVRLFEAGVKIERLSRGVPDTITQLQGPDGEALVPPPELTIEILRNPRARSLMLEALEELSADQAAEAESGG